MAIEMESVNVEVVQRVKVACNRIFLPEISITTSVPASGLASEAVPRAVLAIQPYLAADTDADPSATDTFSSDIDRVSISNIYTAAANIPEIVPVVEALFVASKAVAVYRAARKAEWKSAATAQESAKQALAAAQSAEASARSASNLAQTARDGAANMKLAADQAATATPNEATLAASQAAASDFMAKETALIAAKAAQSATAATTLSARTASEAANASERKARLAYEDPSNPQ